MSRPLAALGVIAAWAAAAAFAQSPAAGLVVEEPAARFGDAYSGAEIVHTFAVRNDGPRPVRVLELRPAAGAALPGPIAPGARAEVTVRPSTQDRLGVATFRFVLKADDGLPDRRLSLSGFLQSAYDPDQPLLTGEVSPGGSAELEVACREVDRLDVVQVEGAPSFLAVDASTRGPEDSVRVRATVAADAPLGVHTGTLRLRTNVGHQPTLGVAYQLRVFEDVAPEDVPVDLGLLREGRPFEKRTLLRSRSGRAFDVKGVEGAAPGLTVEAVPCVPASASCRGLVFKGTGPAPSTGRLGGSVRVLLAEGREIVLPYAGLPVAADAEVRDLGQLGGDAAPAPVPGVKAGPTPAAPAPTPPPVPPPVHGKPGERLARLSWEASQEEQAYGFLIYRSDRREGPFRRVNPKIVPVLTGPPPHRYVYEDREVEPGRSYFYYLESISRAGRKARLSGVVTKVIPPAPSP